MTDPKDDAKRVLAYAEPIRTGAALFGVRPSLLAAVGLRESLLGWARGYFPRGQAVGWGDRGYAFGLFQIDMRTWESYLRRFKSAMVTPEGQATLAAMILDSNLRLLGLAFPDLAAEPLEQAAVAAYNASVGKVAAQIYAGASVDAVTTGSGGPGSPGDYSRDVLAREKNLLLKLTPSLEEKSHA